MTYREARKAGKALLAKMKTTGWNLEVWRECDFGRVWHCCLYQAFVRIYPSVKRTVERVQYYEMDASTFGPRMSEYFAGVRERDPNVLVSRLREKLVEFLSMAVNSLDRFDFNFQAKK